MKSKAVLFLIVVTQLTCHQALFTAPPGSTITCFANPGFIAAFNGVSIISCLVTEPAGTLVADGTVVQFFTTLGRIPEQGRTNDGVVRVNLEADGRSGTADGTAVSGGAASAPASTTPGSSTTTSTTVSPELSSSGGLSASALATVSALQNTATFTVRIGNINVARLNLVAFPPRLTDSRTSQITANVFDASGNPVGGVPVFFEIVDATTVPVPTPVPGTPVPTPTTRPTVTPTPAGGTGEGLEHMDSQGRPVFTDSNGQARDVMRTRYAREAPQRRVRVRATVPVGGGISDEVTVLIN